ncbi:hypothetical protein ABVB25_31630, partial [Streptomyces anthocyanicus]|uniref:hypothetical protein n=1 Tax=Streptomyces anthocyanicus TaxID=68174 RepID=UPI00336A6B47
SAQVLTGVPFATLGQHHKPGVAVHTLTLPRGTPVEARRLSGGNPADLRLDELLDRLAAGRKWAFAIDYDGEGRVHSLREAYWLGD